MSEAEIATLMWVIVGGICSIVIQAVAILLYAMIAAR